MCVIKHSSLTWNCMQYLVRDEKYSWLWGSSEPHEIFSHANKSWFTVIITKHEVLSKLNGYIGCYVQNNKTSSRSWHFKTLNVVCVFKEIHKNVIMNKKCHLFNRMIKAAIIAGGNFYAACVTEGESRSSSCSTPSVCLSACPSCQRVTQVQTCCLLYLSQL
jgi:hypothetical protein